MLNLDVGDFLQLKLAGLRFLYRVRQHEKIEESHSIAQAS